MKKINYEKLVKVFAIVFVGLVTLNIFLPDLFVVSLEENELNASYRPLAIMRWLNAVSFLVLPIAAFFKKDVFKKIAIYFCLPVAVVYLFFFNKNLSYQTSELGRGIYQIRYLNPSIKEFMINPYFRGTLLILTSLSQILIATCFILKDRQVLLFKKKDVMPFVLILIFCFISIVPSYVPQYIIGSYTSFILDTFNFVHLAWVLFLVSEIIVLTLIFRKRSYEDKYIMLLILALTLFFQYNQMFSSLGELTCKRMPLQLCNIGSYLILVALLTKNERLFQFNLIINVVGGLIAMIVMDVEGKGLFYLWNIHYLVEHNNVIVVPLLSLILGIFKPLRKEDYKYFIINFSLYYLFVLILGTLFNGLSVIYESDYFYANYLFMFMKGPTSSIVPFVEPWFDIQINLGAFTLYPLVQGAVYLGFATLGSLAFIVIYNIFKHRLKK